MSWAYTKDPSKDYGTITHEDKRSFHIKPVTYVETLNQAGLNRYADEVFENLKIADSVKIV